MPRYPEYAWLDVAIGGPEKRNHPTRFDRLRLPADPVDCYRTVYRYPDEFRAHVQRTGSVKGYAGPAYADWFPIDIDFAGDVQRSLDELRRAVEILGVKYDLAPAAIRYFFSGSKGFHLLLPDALWGWEPSIQHPVALKTISRTLFGGKIELDPVIYDRVRLFRLSNTRHSKSGLYKVELTPSEALNWSLEEILEAAKAPRHVERSEDAVQNEALAELYRATLEGMREVATATKQVEFDPLKHPPRDQKLCYLRLLMGVGEGNRDNAGLRLAVHYRKQGMAPDMVQAVLERWDARNVPPLGLDAVDKLVRQAFANEYDFGCHDPVLDAVCDQRCHLYAAKKKLPRSEERVHESRIYTMEEAAARYQEYAAKVERVLIKTGVEKLDKAIRGIAPGEVMEVMARSGVGKTAWLINTIRYVSANLQIPVLFFSLEQPVVQIWERAAQIVTRMRGEDVHAVMRDAESAASTVAEVSRQFEGVYVVEEDFLTYDEMVEFIRIAEERKIGRRPGLIAIDYLGRMQSQGRTPYEITSYLAKVMKHLAKEIDVPVIYLHQTSRAGRDGSEEITLDMGRDSGVTEEAADFVLALWRPDLKQEMAQGEEGTTARLKLRVLKNRKGWLGDHELIFDKKTLWIGDKILADERPRFSVLKGGVS